MAIYTGALTVWAAQYSRECKPRGRGRPALR